MLSLRRADVGVIQIKHVSGDPKLARNRYECQACDAVATTPAAEFGSNPTGAAVLAGHDDSLAVPSFGPRMVCKACGTKRADVRPNWVEQKLNIPRP